MEDKDLVSLEEAIIKVAKRLGMKYEDARAMVLKDIQDGVLPVVGIKNKELPK